MKLLALLAIVGVGVGAAIEATPPKACFEDALKCPGGSVVVRDPNNNCQFPPCPSSKPVPKMKKRSSLCTQRL